MSYIATTPQQRTEMLAVCGAKTVDQLFSDIPVGVRPKSFDLPSGKSEIELLSYFTSLAGKNYSHL
ncbi:MAG TPA: hypothetical protein VKO63_00345, partial [Chitinispirillaceae bacterium]|nr:hypothetical protein [Chitinispirillaceae bacterium]